MRQITVENRATERSALPLPARVEVRGSDTLSWHENIVLRDVSPMGAGFKIGRPIKRGTIFMLSTKLPQELRKFDLYDEMYDVWALVRRCIEISMPRRAPYYVVGAAFVGKFPPPDYLHNPTALFDLAEVQPANDGFWRVIPNHFSGAADGFIDQRKHSRLQIPEAVLLEATGPDGQVCCSEFSVAENISAGGATVFTQMDVEPGAFLRATCRRTDDTIIAVVRGKTVGSDGLTRLNLEFVDKLFPMDGMM